jgi:hypothetical protein
MNFHLLNSKMPQTVKVVAPISKMPQTVAPPHEAGLAAMSSKQTCCNVLGEFS